MKPDYEELRALKLWFEKHYPQDMPYCPHNWNGLLERVSDLSQAQLQQGGVSGKRPDYPTIRAAAILHMEKVCSSPEYGDEFKRYCISDFIAGAEWGLLKAACASSAAGTVAEREPFDCYEIHRPNIPANGCKTQCEECAARKSSEGQP